MRDFLDKCKSAILYALSVYTERAALSLLYDAINPFIQGWMYCVAVKNWRTVQGCWLYCSNSVCSNSVIFVCPNMVCKN